MTSPRFRTPEQKIMIHRFKGGTSFKIYCPILKNLDREKNQKIKKYEVNMGFPQGNPTKFLGGAGGGGCRATLRHLGPAHQESPGPGPESPMQTGTSLNLSKPGHGGHVSTGVSQLPRHGCCKRQALSSARKSLDPRSRESSAGPVTRGRLGKSLSWLVPTCLVPSGFGFRWFLSAPSSLGARLSLPLSSVPGWKPVGLPHPAPHRSPIPLSLAS